MMNQQRVTSAHQAAESGQEKECESFDKNLTNIQLLANGACIAAYEGRIGVVKNYLDKKYDVNATLGSTKLTPLHYAVQGNQDEVVQLLLDNGADIEGENDLMPLHFAVIDNHYEIAKFLLDRKANTEAKVIGGNIGKDTVLNSNSLLSYFII